MHAVLINRKGRCREVRLRECAYRDRDHVLMAFNCIVDRSAAGGAEVKGGSRARIADTHEFGGRAFDLRALPGKASLGTKDTARAALACQAVADRDADGISGGHHGQLPAAARCCPSIHRSAESLDRSWRNRQFVQNIGTPLLIRAPVGEFDGDKTVALVELP